MTLLSTFAATVLHGLETAAVAPNRAMRKLDGFEAAKNASRIPRSDFPL